MTSNMEIIGLVMVVGGLICLAGAWYTNAYTEYFNAGIFGAITRKPLQQYAFPLAFSAIFLFVCSGVVAVEVSVRPKRIVLKPVSMIPVQPSEKCPHCGYELSYPARFCPNCGQPVKPDI